jgi:hypothetical protein
MSAVSLFLISRMKTLSFLNSRIARILAVGVAAVTLTGCATATSIAHINKDPGRYAGREVTIAGRVARSVGAMGDGIFQIDDGSGRMWVYSQGLGVPGSGSKVAISGHIQQGFSFGGHSFAVVLKENQRRR